MSQHPGVPNYIGQPIRVISRAGVGAYNPDDLERLECGLYNVQPIGS